MLAKQPIFSSVVINSAGATVGIGSHISEFSYSDVWGVMAAHCEFDLAPTATIIPKIGDFIEIKFKYSHAAADQLINTGTMRVDDIVRRHDIPVLSVGMSAIDYNLGIISRRPTTYNNANLRNIVVTQANSVSGGLTIIPDVNRIPATVVAGTSSTITGAKIISTESRAEMLLRVARDYGFYFNLKRGQIYFEPIYDAEARTAARTLTKSDVCSDSQPQIRQSTSGVYGTFNFWYNDAGQTGLYALSATGANTSALYDGTGEYYYDLQSVQFRALGQNYESNKNQYRGSITCEGSHLLQTGNTIELSSDFSPDNGKYIIESSIHTIRPSDGWRTQLDIRKILV